MNENTNKAVAVKCEGCFTEWYVPTYKEPYADNAEYRDYFDKHIIKRLPVLGPSFGDDENDRITDDLDCLAERMVGDADDWAAATYEYAEMVMKCLADGKPRTLTFEGVEDVRFTPYTKEELPPVNEKSLEVYGDFKELIRERVAAI